MQSTILNRTAAVCHAQTTMLGPVEVILLKGVIYQCQPYCHVYRDRVDHWLSLVWQCLVALSYLGRGVCVRACKCLLECMCESVCFYTLFREWSVFHGVWVRVWRRVDFLSEANRLPQACPLWEPFLVSFWVTVWRGTFSVTVGCTAIYGKCNSFTRQLPIFLEMVQSSSVFSLIPFILAQCGCREVLTKGCVCNFWVRLYLMMSSWVLSLLITLQPLFQCHSGERCKVCVMEKRER